MNQLLKFQEESMPLLISRKHNLLADEMGLGKTVQAIELMNRIRALSVLVVCKASIKQHWKMKIDQWSTTARWVQIIQKKTDNLIPMANVVIVNYDLINHSYLFQQLIAEQWGLLICDEAHYLKNMDAKRTKAVLAKNGLAHHADRTLMMTGTPVLNRPAELYPILKVLAPAVIAPYNDYWAYAHRYCDAWMDGFALNDKGASHTDELNMKLRQHYMIRRTWNDVENQLPKRRYEIFLIDTDGESDRKLQILARAECGNFKHQKLDVDAGGLATLRREVAEGKIDVCLDQIKSYIEGTFKLVIFAYHHTVIERLTHELREYGVVTLTGKTSNVNRQFAIDSFQRREDIKVFLGQVDAAGEGIDGLQTVCHNILFIEWSWSPGAIAQAIARLHRIGQTKPVLIRFLVWANSIEEHQMRTALDKVQVIREIMK